MESAIKIAIENGYVNQAIVTARRYDVDFHGLTGEQAIKYTCLVSDMLNNAALLDPLFWQALGKGLGWGRMYSKSMCSYDDYDGDWTPIKLDRWEEEWHRFIDHLAEGKDIDSFFTSLLPTN